MTAARRALLHTGEFAVAADVEKPRIAGAHRAEHVFFRRDDAFAAMRDETRRRDFDLTLVEPAARRGPLLDAALHHRHRVVAITTQCEPEPRRVMAALRVVAHDHRVVADPEAAHRLPEGLGSLQHPPWVAGRGWGSGEVLRPVAVHGARQMPAQIVRVRVAFEHETAVDHTHLGIAQLRGGPLGGPKEIGTREGTHMSDFSR